MLEDCATQVRQVLISDLDLSSSSEDVTVWNDTSFWHVIKGFPLSRKGLNGGKGKLNSFLIFHQTLFQKYLSLPLFNSKELTPHLKFQNFPCCLLKIEAFPGNRKFQTSLPFKGASLSSKGYLSREVERGYCLLWYYFAGSPFWLADAILVSGTGYIYRLLRLPRFTLYLTEFLPA